MLLRSSKLAILAVAALSTSACVSTKKPNEQFRPSTGFSPTLNRSPMDPALECMAQATGAPGRRPLRIAVGQIKDYTGKFSNEASEGGFKVTQGGSLMVISALGKLRGIDQVERFDTTVADQEATLAKAQLVRDPDQQHGQVVRPLTAGMYDGSDFYIVGGITEANFTISSGGVEANISQLGAGSRYYVMNVAADLRLVETKSLHVVKTISVQKQIVGREVKAGVFNFLGDYLVDINLGNKSNEPIQMGVRATLELGTLELLSPLYDNYFTKCRAIADAGFGVRLGDNRLVPPPGKGGPGPATQQAQKAPSGQAPAPQAAAAPSRPVETLVQPRVQVVAAARDWLPARPPAPELRPVSGLVLALASSVPAGEPNDLRPTLASGDRVPGKYRVQLGALPSAREAGKLWETLAAVHPAQFSGKSKKIVQVEREGSSLYRALVDGFDSRAAANSFCDSLTSEGHSCFVRG